jgi:site-specific DNA-methyltransferase (adenine-specific)
VIQDTDNLTPEKVHALLQDVIPELARVMKTGAHLYLFHAFEHYQYLVDGLYANGFLVPPTPIIWDKEATTVPALGFNFPSSYEPILFAICRERTRRLQEPPRNIIRCKSIPINERLHKFQKPERLITTLLGCSTVAGDLVLDPFAGSGAVVKAAHALNRRSLGFEVNQTNWQAAQLNLSVAKAQKTAAGSAGGVL